MGTLGEGRELNMENRIVSRASRWSAVLVVVAGTLAACGSSATSAPTTTAVQLTGWRAPAVFSTPPATGQIIDPLSANPSDLTAHGYTEQEYFASGTAYSFASRSAPSNGMWTVAVAGSSPYRTRILVRRPSDPAKFDGNVVVEWMNVSASESAPDWDYLDPALMDSGAAYVAVSTQALAVNGGKALLGSGSSPGLRQKDPARYGTLDHPGDQYSLDMFAQIGQALRTAAPSVLGGLRPSHVVAIGESQSAFYLTTYADAIQPLDNAYQGIFIHSRGGGAAPFAPTDVTSAIKGNVHIRTDLSVPVFMFETQTDLIQLGYAAAQQPNTSKIRTWEVAGMSHADAYELGVGAGFLGCTTPVNSGPQHEVAQSAFTAFLHWVDDGKPPQMPKPFTLSSTAPAVLALDAHGNVVAGVRTPAVDVPVSTLSGSPPPGSSTLCGLFGSTVPFSSQTLVALYGSKASYVAAFTSNLDRAIAAGYVLPADRAGLLAQAMQVPFPS
jgi:Alpha/beta hydrolase domain